MMVRIGAVWNYCWMSANGSHIIFKCGRVDLWASVNDGFLGGSVAEL